MGQDSALHLDAVGLVVMNPLRDIASLAAVFAPAKRQNVHQCEQSGDAKRRNQNLHGCRSFRRLVACSRRAHYMNIDDYEFCR